MFLELSEDPLSALLLRGQAIVHVCICQAYLLANSSVECLDNLINQAEVRVVSTLKYMNSLDIEILIEVKNSLLVNTALPAFIW